MKDIIQTWINIQDLKPEYGKRVLVIYDDEVTVGILIRTDILGNWFKVFVNTSNNYSILEISNIKFWQLLPAMYTEWKRENHE